MLADDNEMDRIPRQRLGELLALLDSEGVSQREVAARANVPPQYLSDVKGGRRTMTELFARRLGEEFGVDYVWLLGHTRSMEPPRVTGGARASGSSRLWLPVFSELIEGKPQGCPNFDGSAIEVAGAAAAQTCAAHQPYVLRLGVNDRHSRLVKGDLVLISQAVNEEAEIQVVKIGSKRLLARRKGKSSWEPVAPARPVSREATAIGHCLGIVWASL